MHIEELPQSEQRLTGVTIEKNCVWRRIFLSGRSARTMHELARPRQIKNTYPRERTVLKTIRGQITHLHSQTARVQRSQDLSQRLPCFF